MTKEIFLEKMKSLYIKCDDMMKTDDPEKAIGRLVMLAQDAKEENLDAALELIVLGVLMKEKENEK